MAISALDQIRGLQGAPRPNRSAAFAQLAPLVPWDVAGAYTVDPTRARDDPEGGQAALTRAQWRLFQEKYVPLEDEALATIMDGNLSATVANRAGQRVSEAFAGSDGMTDRRLARRGLLASASDRQVFARNRGLDRATAIAGAENTARQQTSDLRLALAGDAMQIGQGISGQASQGLSSAGSLASARDQQNKAAKAAQKQSNLAMGSSLAGTALMAAALFA